MMEGKEVVEEGLGRWGTSDSCTSWTQQPRDGETHFKVPKSPVLETSDPWQLSVRNAENYREKRASARVKELKTMGTAKEGCADGFLSSSIPSKR